MDLIRFIFASFGAFAYTIYSQHSFHIRFKIFAQTRIQIIDLMQKNACCSEYSFQSEYLLKIFSYWRIFASKYLVRISHSNEYSLANIRIQANIRIPANLRYVLLQII
jgi:hypothetical protein